LEILYNCVKQSKFVLSSIKEEVADRKNRICNKCKVQAVLKGENECLVNLGDQWPLLNFQHICWHQQVAIWAFSWFSKACMMCYCWVKQSINDVQYSDALGQLACLALDSISLL